MNSIDVNKKLERDCCICHKKIDADEISTKCPICKQRIESSISKVRYYLRIFVIILAMAIILFLSKYVIVIHEKSLFYIKILIEFLFYELGQFFIEISWALPLAVFSFIIPLILIKFFTIIELIILNTYKKYFLVYE